MGAGGNQFPTSGNRGYGFYRTGHHPFNDRDPNYAYAIGSPRYVKFASEGEYA